MRRPATLVIILGLITAVAALLVFDRDGSIGGVRTDDFAQGGYLAIVGLVLLLGMFATLRADIAGAAKAAGLWLLGFALLVAIYAYRDELREFGDRMLAELMPGRVIAVAGTKGASLMIRRANDGHFHADADVEGSPVTFMIDTGASIVALNRRTAESLGYDPAGLRFTTVVQTANGTARAAPVRLASIRIGTIERRDVQAAVMETPDIDVNLLGMSFLGTLSSVEFQGSRLLLRD